MDDVSVLRDVLYGGSCEVQTRDLAAALFDALGAESAAKLAARLAKEVFEARPR